MTQVVVSCGDNTTHTFGSDGVPTHTDAVGLNTSAVTVVLVDVDGIFLGQTNDLSVASDNIPSSAVPSPSRRA